MDKSEKTQTNSEKMSAISEMQDLVNELRKNPQYEKYVEMQQLHLLDDRFKGLDILLKEGLLK